MTRERLKYLLDRYLEDTATEEESAEYAAWYEQAGSEGPELFEHADAPEAREYSEALFADIISRIDVLESLDGPSARGRYLPFIWWAAAAVLITAVFLLFSHTGGRRATPIAQQRTAKDTTAKDIVSITNNTGRKKQVRFQDGSVADLFPGSGLSYDASFGHTHRTVTLRGKAFFNVARDPAHPFTVYSHDIVTTVLGTSFTITAYPYKHEVIVKLHTGKVLVKHIARNGGNSMKEVYLLPGQQLSCDVTAGKAILQQAAAHNAVDMDSRASPGLRSGFAITFDRAPMTAVLDSMERGYNVSLQYKKEEMADMLFSGSIRETDSLAQVLKRIAALYDLSIRTADKKYVIKKKH